MNTYELVAAQIRELADEEPHWVPVLANASALVFDAIDGLNWAGFYLMRQGELVLGPFQGKVACVRIALGRGVCGTAAKLDQTQLVPDVHAFPGHIACDSASAAEVVVPLHANGQVIGVLDIDSPIMGRFTQDDAAGFELIARAIEEVAQF